MPAPVPQPVLNTFTRQAEATVIIGYDGGSVEATTEHPFWVEDRGWVPAAQLQPGDALSGRQGITYTVTALATRTGQQTVYNLEIAEFHTYHVADGQLLVHNGCGIPKKRTINRYEFELDENGDTVSAEGYYRRYNKHKRPGQAEKSAVQGVQVDDHVGHLMPHGGHGPSDSINLVAQNGWANSSPESPWWQLDKFLLDQSDVHGPEAVYVKKTILGRDASGRPTGVRVEWWINDSPGQFTDFSFW